MKDEFLNQFDQPAPPRPIFAEALYRRINQPMIKPNRLKVYRAVALTAAVCAALALTLLFSPPVRAFADGLIRQVGGYIFVQGTDKNTRSQKDVQPSGTPVKKTGDLKPNQPNNSKSDPAGKAGVLSSPDAAGATVLAGFTVLAPAYLPTGFTQQDPWMVMKSDTGGSVTTAYQGAGSHMLIVTEEKDASKSPQTYTLPNIQDVTIHGQPGVWLPEGGKNTLMWQEDGITISLMTDSLPLAEVQKVAESLGK
jgi:hypothetical protein